MMIQQLADNMIESWRHEIAGIRLKAAIGLLGALGSYQLDKATILTPRGYRHIAICDAILHLPGEAICSRIRPVYFHGGPLGAKRYRGSLETMILDRLLLTASEKGGEHTLWTINYVADCYKKWVRSGDVSESI